MRRSALPPLLCSALLALVACGGDGKVTRDPAPRLLVIGWDGATFDLLDPLVEAGRLPHVAELLGRGQAATLESTRIPISSAAWTSAMTGVGPGEHGVYGFFEPVPTPTTCGSSTRRAPRRRPCGACSPVAACAVTCSECR